MSQGLSGARGEGFVAPVGPVSTETIQKYLDENQALIVAIVENQNLGKLNECAQYQARLQQNLMYLAAIADAQPQPQAQATMMQQGTGGQLPAQFSQQQQYGVMGNPQVHKSAPGRDQFTGPGTYR